ncbi:MAG: carboxypeptidase regulatory-like domain-containing protein [Deltaproteobacteria bacterium]|nr:carboxypeptidase regulatory-like domain-containing protein [Deltaproteobacteria bacterium]
MRALACISLTLLAACPPGTKPPPKDPVIVTGAVDLLEAPLSPTPRRFTVAGVKVVLEGEFTNVSETDDTGAYRFEGMPPGKYTVRASYGDFTREGEVTASLEAASGTNVDAPPLTLTPAGAITGRATLGGKQMGNLGIRVSVDGTDLVTTTDDAGKFYLARVPVGSYRIRVEKSDFGGRTMRGVDVKFEETTDIGTLDIIAGIFSDFNNPPVFTNGALVMKRYQRAPGTVLDPLPLDIGGSEIARHDSLKLDAPATDLDGDRLTYFWSVTAGVLDRTDGESVLWTVNDDTALAATITARVVDERSASAYLTADFTIVDAQTLSGRLVGDHAVYAYRRFSGKWRVLDYNLTTSVLDAVGDLTSLDDPQVAKVGAHYIASPFNNGDRQIFAWQKGETPAARTVDGEGRGLPLGTRYIRAKTETGKMRVVSYDPAAQTTGPLFDCGSAGCGELVATRGDFAVTLLRTADDFVNTVVGFNAATSTKQTLALSSAVGTDVRTDGGAIVHADVPPGFGRSQRNAIVRERFPNGAGGDVYFGFYDVFVGAFDGRFVGFTEQEYRVVYAPEKAFLYDTTKNQKLPIDENEDYAYDAVLDLGAGKVLVRRYTRNDWLDDEQRTHFELCTRPLE